MKNALSLDKLTLKELSAIASAAKVPRWSRMKKTELLARLVALGAAAPSLEQAFRIRDAKRRGISCDPASSSDVRSAAAGEKRSSVAKTSSAEQVANVAPAPAAKKSAEKRVRRAVSTPNVAPSPASTTLPPRAKSKSAKNAKSALPVETKSSARVSEPLKSAKSKNASSAAARSDAKSAVPSAAATRSSEPEAPAPPSRVSTLREKMRLRKTLGRETDATDRLVLAVCDSYWLRACWEVTPRLVERVRSAMGRHWHTADPTLRLFKIDKEPQGATRREFVADVPVRGGVDVWYLDVDDPPSSFMVELGYLARDKQFFTLISSNVVETPQRSVREAFAGLGAPSDFNGFAQRAFPGAASGFGAARSNPFATNDATSGETKFAGALERSFGASNGTLLFQNDFQFNVDAEIVVRGTASPGVGVRVKEEPVRVKDDGTFSIRYRLPERRHVFPVVATSADGVETQTIILAIDRNTKILEPVFKEEEEE